MVVVGVGVVVVTVVVMAVVEKSCVYGKVQTKDVNRHRATNTKQTGKQIDQSKEANKWK